MMYTLLSVRWDNKFLMTNISKVLGFYEDILNEKHPMYHQKDNLVFAANQSRLPRKQFCNYV